MTDERGWIVECEACGQRNRVPYERLGEAGTCGRCGKPLPAPRRPLDLPTEGAFERLVGGATPPVVVDFWAPWCGPCRAVAPELERVAEASSGRLLVAKVNTEELPALAQRHGIMGIPTMAVFLGGHEVARTSGARPAAAIEQFVRDALGARGPSGPGGNRSA
ncbi:MAG: thioredoxin fold domain-containing protein [Chthonomonadales bacterium]|nr:thioredoxin fold domain-containing protein [Chthonomonadales bacterium]